MTVELAHGATVMFAGDSITDCHRLDTDEPLGYGYPLRIAGAFGLAHPDRDIRWLNSGISGNKVMDLEERWRRDVLDTVPDVVSLLVGINDVGWHRYDPAGRVIPLDEFDDGYRRLLEPLTAADVRLILIEPFLLPVDDEQRSWRDDLDPKIQAVRRIAADVGATLIAADGMFAQLASTTGPRLWAADGVHPTAAGHAALARAWLDVVV